MEQFGAGSKPEGVEPLGQLSFGGDRFVDDPGRGTAVVASLPGAAVPAAREFSVSEVSGSH